MSWDFVARRLRPAFFSARVALALLVTVPPLWVLVAMTPARSVHRLTQRWARVIVGLCGCRPRVIGLQRLPPPNISAVMIANHSSFLDAVVLLATIPGDYRFVTNHLAAGRPLLGTIIRKSGHLVVDRRSMRSRAACARAIEGTLTAGTSLMLFPEGTRGRRGLLPFHLGAFRAAVKTARPVIPIAIEGTRQMLPRDLRLAERGPLAVHVLAPIPGDGSVTGHAARLRDAARAAIAAALVTPRPPAAPPS